jgi:tRNA-dihydrouridine synthase
MTKKELLALFKEGLDQRERGGGLILPKTYLLAELEEVLDQHDKSVRLSEEIFANLQKFHNESKELSNNSALVISHYSEKLKEYTKGRNNRLKNIKRKWDWYREKYNEKNKTMDSKAAKNSIANLIKKETGKKPSRSTLYRQLVVKNK